MQSKRWWLAAVLSTLICSAGATAVHAAPKPALDLSAASLSDMTSFVQKHAKDMQAACAAGKMADVTRTRDEVLSGLDPAFQPPARSVFDYSGEVVTAFAPLLNANAKPNPDPANEAAANALALNAAIIVCNPNLDYLTNDRALGVALQNRNAGVRYWAAKGLDAHMPLLAGQLPVAVVGAAAGGKGLLNLSKIDLANEPSALVAGQLHAALAHTALAVKDTPMAAKVLEVLATSLFQRAAAWQQTAPSAAEMTGATASLTAVAELVGKPNSVVLAGAARTDSLSAVCAYLSYGLQWDVQQKTDPSAQPVSPPVYHLIEVGNTVIEAVTGYAMPGLTPSTKALDALLQVNGAVGPGGKFFEKFKEIKQPGNIPSVDK